MRLYLVRHGETKAKSLGSRTFNTGLSDKGIEQAKRCGLFFKNKKIDVVYCSVLERAKQTLECMRPFLGNAKVIFTSEINERSKGKYKNDKEYEVALKASGLKDHQFRPRYGENYFDVEKRAQSFWEFLKKNHSEDTVLLVGHGIFFRLLILQMFHLPMREMAYFDLEDCSISYFEVEGEKIINSKINDCTHLLNSSTDSRERRVD